MIDRRGILVCGLNVVAFGGLGSPARATSRPMRLRARLTLPPTIGRARAFLVAPALLLGLRAPFGAGCVRGTAEEITPLADGSGAVASWRAGALEAWLEAEQILAIPPFDVASLRHVGAGWIETPSGCRALLGGAISLSAVEA